MIATNFPRPSRMVRPQTDSVYLRSQDRPIDYGHCHMLLTEKYGEERGSKSYEDIGQRNAAALFVVGQEIQKEKIKMLTDLGRAIPQDLSDVEYFEIWTEWKAKGLYKKVA